MKQPLTHSVIMNTLDWAYDKSINGLPGFDSAEEMANDYLNGSGTLEEKVNSLIRWQNTKSAANGFVAGLGGAIILPIAIPINIGSVIYVQIRMIAAIAHMGGYDLRDDRVKSMVYVCLCGNAAKDITKEVGIKLGTKLTESAIKKLSHATVIKINQKVGFKLLTKFGEKGIVNLGKMVPFVGGVIGGTFDGVSTNIIGNIARDTFIPAKVKVTL